MYSRYKGNDRGRVIVEREGGDDKSREGGKSSQIELPQSSPSSTAGLTLVLDQCQTSERLLGNPMFGL